MEQTFMKEKKILPLVLTMSLPMVISMAVSSLYNIIDSYFVARIGEEAITALSLVFPAQNLINALAIGFGISINARIAFYLGAGDQERADQTATLGVFLSFLHGVLMMAVCILLMPWFLGQFTSDPETIRLALLYSNRAFLFSPVIALGLCLPVNIRWRYLSPDRVIIRKLYSTGIPAALNLALPSVLISALNGILADFSEKYVLVLGVYYKLQTFIYLTANGIIQGIRPLVGYNYGAGEYGRVKKIHQTTLTMSIAVMVLGTVLSWAIPKELMGLFTDNSETIALGARALQIISLGFVVSAVSVTCSGVLEGLGKGFPSLFLSLLRNLVFMIPTAWLLSRLAGADGVWWAFCVTELVCAGAGFFLYRKEVPES